MDLSVNLAGIALKNPLVMASGTAGYGADLISLCGLTAIGAVTLKSITAEPKAGNPSPRIWETTGGMLNSIGLENVGIDAFMKETLPSLESLGTRLIVSIAGETIGEYTMLARRVSEAAGCFAALEINVSCPNVEKGGLLFGSDPDACEAVTEAVVGNSGLPVFVKLSASVGDLEKTAVAVAGAGASGLSVTNTLPGMAIDPITGRPRLGALTGGLSGPAIKPVALKAVWDCYRATGLPVIGGGGVYDVYDVLEFLYAGANAVSVGTSSFQDFSRVEEIAGGLPGALECVGVSSPMELIGKLKAEEV